MTPAELLGTWDLGAQWLGVLAVAALYAWGVRRARPWPARRSAAFGLGVAGLAVALCSGVDAGAAERLSVHMVQHGLLTLVVPPLLLAGAPVRLALRAQRPPGRRRLARALHAAPVRLLTQPAVALALFAVVLAGFHVPAVYDLALRVPAVHGLEHAAYLWVSLLLWAPLVAADPVPHRLGAVGRVAVLVGAMTVMGAVGARLTAAERVVYAAYAGRGGDPLADQAMGGGIMSMGGLAVVLPAAVWLAWRALIDEERRARAAEGL
jgi:putative copper resistance protein D